MIKGLNRVSITSLFLAIFLTSLPIQAQDNWQLDIINHFDQPLNFIITINPQVIPDLTTAFTLDVNAQRDTRVLAMNKEAYLRTLDAADHSAFWGVEVLGKQLTIHGYISKGIAYSWHANQLVFCTPVEYKRYHSCIH